MSEDDYELIMQIPSNGGFLRVGHKCGKVVIAAHEIEIGEAARLELAIDEAVARARAWADGEEG